MTDSRTPQGYHERRRKSKVERPRHREERWEDCWACQRQLAMCKSKRRFDTIDLALEACRLKNEETRYALGLVPYWCRFCGGWHRKRAKNSGNRRKIYKQRRDFLVAEREKEVIAMHGLMP